MYVLGGYTDDSLNILVGQMFSLDLSKSWSTSSPAFKSLSDGKAGAAIANSLTADNKNWFMINNKTAYLYNFEHSNWSTLNSGNILSAVLGLSAATNPDSGRIYIPNGYFDATSNTRSELIYFAQESEFHYTGMASNLLSTRLHSVVWSPVRKGVLFFGGYDTDTNRTSNNMYIYDPNTGWSTLVTKGYTTANAIINDTVVYNIKTGSWTTNYIATKPKSNLGLIIGCSVGGVVLIALGGLVFYKQRSKKRKAVTVANPTSTVVVAKPTEFVASTDPSRQSRNSNINLCPSPSFNPSPSCSSNISFNPNPSLSPSLSLNSSRSCNSNISFNPNLNFSSSPSLNPSLSFNPRPSRHNITKRGQKRNTISNRSHTALRYSYHL
ncbi:hypothetical protein BGZ58_009485 [Dissophora ornata]|nr:hypothetical protein BGZ58_009485 [Dissophora ornata]